MGRRNTKGLEKHSKTKNTKTIEKVNAAIERLKRSRVDSINFSTVAKEASVSKATLYNNDVLRERILGLRITTKGVPNITESSAKSIDRTANKGYLDEIRKLREDKKNLILQLIEIEALRDENAKLKAKLDKQNRKGGYIL